VSINMPISTLDHDQQKINRQWYEKYHLLYPCFREDAVLLKMPSFILMVDLPQGEKRQLSIFEGSTIALCNGKLTIEEITNIWKTCFEISLEESIDMVSQTLTTYRPYFILQDHQKLSDNRYKGADFVYAPEPFKLDYNQPYPYPIEGIFALTNKCNLRCIYCYRSGAEAWESELSTAEILDAIDQAADMGIVRAFVTGGEPLIHPDVVLIYTHLLKKKVFPYMSTNGTLVTPSLVSQFVDAGMPIIQISLDAVSQKLFSKMVGIETDENLVEQAIQLFVKAGVPVMVKGVVSKLNLSDIPNLIHRCSELGVTRLSLEGFTPSIGGRGNETLMVDDQEENALAKTVSQWQNNNPGKMEMEGFYLAKKWKKPEDIVPCGGMITSFVMQPNGDIALCENLGEIPDLVFGNIRKMKLKDIWGSEKVMEFLNPNPLNVDPLCRDCEHFRICRTGCFNRSLVKSGTIWGPDSFCWKLNSNYFFL
jgi:radical SAM protein with 4Fe4S-binding SPASM domain